MVTLYESNGNFNSGLNSYRSLVSKRSRGTILLTENMLSFESQIDKILFQIKISDVQEFSIKHRRSLPLLELNTTLGPTYNLYPRNDKKKLPHASQIMTEELFRQLVRLKFNEDQPILFDTIGAVYPGSFQNFTFKISAMQGHIFLTENYILFKSFKHGILIQIKVLEIKNIIMEIKESTTYVTVKTLEGDVYSFIALKNHYRRYIKDKIKTEKLYDVLNQTKMYKASEPVKLEKEEKFERLEKEQKTNIECLYCGKIFRSEVKYCPSCGAKSRE